MVAAGISDISRQLMVDRVQGRGGERGVALQRKGSAPYRSRPEGLTVGAVLASECALQESNL